MISLKTKDEIEAIAKAGAILAGMFDAIVPEIRPGVSTSDLDLFGENFIMSYDGAVPSLAAWAYIAVAARQWAGLNPDAFMRDPLSIDDVVNARMISDPLGLRED